MAVDSAASPYAPARRRWLIGVLALTVAPFVVVVALAPSGSSAPTPALTWLLFVGSSAHVAATGWFFTVREVRTHMRQHPARYVIAPVALICGLAAALPLCSARVVSAVLLAFFGWQFFHFQKQNLGVAALAARASEVTALTRRERRALVVAGLGGVAALVGHPDLLQVRLVPRLEVLFVLGGAGCAAGVVVGVVALLRRPAPDRPLRFVAAYLAALLFFVPVFVFASPYAAVAGLTIAHGLQYLLLVGSLAGSGDRSRTLGLIIFLDLAVGLGLVLAAASHLDDAAGAGRIVFGAYLGVVCAHFVIDAGLWRLRDRFPREFLAQRLPFLLA